MQREPARWCTRFGSFVSRYTVRTLARDLAASGAPVTPWSVYSWLSGRTVPRLPMAQKIVELSAGLLSLDDVVRHRHEINN